VDTGHRVDGADLDEQVAMGPRGVEDIALEQGHGPQVAWLPVRQAEPVVEQGRSEGDQDGQAGGPDRRAEDAALGWRERRVPRWCRLAGRQLPDPPRELGERPSEPVDVLPVHVERRHDGVRLRDAGSLDARLVDALEGDDPGLIGLPDLRFCDRARDRRQQPGRADDPATHGRDDGSGTCRG
jgi:hypothetical protein